MNTSVVNENEYKFKFSIIMSVYKVEEFIDEAVESLVNQTLDFKENVQLIMVDDGSPDGSGAICDKYAELYPENVVVIHKENGGLSSARNEGLKHIEGRYVNFLDPDDVLTPNTLESVYNFFNSKDEFIDMVAIPLYYFDAKTGQHPTNTGKFNKGNRIISLRKDYTLIHNSVASAFIKHSVAKNMRFDPDLCAMEDAKALIEFLIFNPRYGVVSDCKYMYRQRTVGAVSLSHGAQMRKNWYTDFIHRFSLAVVNYCLEKINYVPKFVQAVLLYDLHWKIEQEYIPEGVLTPEEENEFREAFYSVFNYIDDELLMNSKYYYFEHKSLILSKKYKTEMAVELYNKDALFTIHGTPLRYFSNMCSTKLEQLKISGDTLDIEVNTFILPIIFEKIENVRPVIVVNDEDIIECEIVKRDTTKYVLGEKAFDNLAFRTNINLKQIEYKDGAISLELCVMLGEHRAKISKFSFSDFSAVTDRYKNQYAAMGDYIVYMKNSCIVIKPYSKKLHRAKERAFRKELWKSNKLGERKAVIVRAVYSILKHFKKKKIYLISDRINKADDNGEAMLRFYDSSADYVKKNNIDYYFIIEKDSKFGKENKSRHIVQVYSMKHKLLHLLADNVLSSHADNFINKPMYETFDCYRDCVAYQNFIFLQHGITQNDISGWLNKYNKNIRGFVTAARPETKSLLTYNYYYKEDEVWELGFARFDRLYRDEKKCITLMPTWRKYLMNGSDDRTGIWALGQGFESSNYYTFYNSLINDERLLAACRQYGYRLCFMPHPNIIPHIDVFDKNDEVTFFGIDTNYRDIYAMSDMVLTDYSSAAFDFAYLRKPLAYMHFDYDEFFGGSHVATPGYFNYREHGFGEVVTTVEETVDLIISYMQSNCELKDEYRRRIDEFFVYNDKNNCQRIADKIVEINS
ncbi:MAG: CDP-glycerol glycerophosphotransferase family protein [Clostridia bacterium]|nr:CDP-glycerol glycerophosphotransferase family protein [Clostridia bacterium]